MDKNNILIGLSESDKTKFGKENFAVQSVPQKVFSAIWAVESEVNNGGFAQYFQNSTSAETASFLVEALNTIGAPRTADICRRAIECAFPSGLPATTEGICSAAEQIADGRLDELQGLDSEFMQYPHNLTDLLFAYVVDHPEEFGPLPTTE